MKKIRYRPGRFALALALALAVPAGFGFLASGPASASTTAYTPIKNAGPSQLCLDVMSEDGLQNENARLQLYHCTGVSEQKFLLVQADTGEGPVPGYFEIRPQSDPSMCLVPYDQESAFNGQPVPNGQGAQEVQQSCFAFAQDQNWTFKSTNEIVNQFWGMCLDTTGSGSRDHEHVMIWPCNGNLAQRWLS
jgi:hypothetical protein